MFLKLQTKRQQKTSQDSTKIMKTKLFMLTFSQAFGSFIVDQEMKSIKHFRFWDLLIDCALTDLSWFQGKKIIGVYL